MNQQHFELDYDQLKNEIIAIDEKIGQEVVSLLEQVHGLDALRLEYNRKQEELSEAQKRKQSANAEEKWSHISTYLEFSEELYKFTKEELCGHLHNRQDAICALQQQQDRLVEIENKTALKRKQIADDQDAHNRAMEEFYRCGQSVLEKLMQTTQVMRTQKNRLTTSLEGKRADSLALLRKLKDDTCAVRMERQNLLEEKCALFLEATRIEAEGQDQVKELEKQLDTIVAACCNSRECHQNEMADSKAVSREQFDVEMCSVQTELNHSLERSREAEKKFKNVTDQYRSLQKTEDQISSRIQITKIQLEQVHAEKEKCKAVLAQKLDKEANYCKTVLRNAEADFQMLRTETKQQCDRVVFLKDELKKAEAALPKVFQDQKEAKEMINEMENQIKEEKMKRCNDRFRNQEVSKWKSKFLKPGGTTPHLHFDRLRKQMCEMNRKLDHLQQKL